MSDSISEKLSILAINGTVNYNLENITLEGNFFN